ncbi:MAG: Uma2 family endonuclease [Lentimicrobiaceae bacterium]|nr:Uma2 family endonuclease [Lentimicrobiaceae bacterium]
MNKEKGTHPYKVVEEEPTKVEEPLIRFETLNLEGVKRYTYADYLTWFDDVRRELIRGFVHLMSAPNLLHSQLSQIINWFLLSFVKQNKGQCQIFHAPFDVRLPKNNETADDKIINVVQPDICVVCDLSKLDERGCIGAPDLIVEVLSPSTSQKDWGDKFYLYEESGVREYWIVDPKVKAISIFLLQTNGKYDDGTVYTGAQKAPVHIFEGLEIDLRELFTE